MIDALFLVGSRFLFLKQQQYVVLVTPSLWWHMWSVVLAVEREGEGGGYCVQITNPPPRATHR